MVENPFDSAAVTSSSQRGESTVPTPPHTEEKPLIVSEEAETEAEIEDEENLEQPENQFDELDEELTDIEESTDTVWLLRRVGLGIIKTLLILSGLGLVGWLIWGGGDTTPSNTMKNVETPIQTVATVENSIETKLDSLKKEITFMQEKQPEKKDNQSVDVLALNSAVTSTAGRSLSTWNYWLETQRISAQKGTPAEVLRWKREVEILFEIPFPQQINGNNPIERNHQVGVLLQRIDQLLNRAAILQKKLLQDIIEFTDNAAIARNQSLEFEQEFLNALQSSNPVGISAILDKKIEAEKLLQQHAVDAEAREIFAQKISEYSLVLENMQTLLTMNRDAIVQDIQVVNFPSDPFGRVIAPGEWQVK